MPGRRFHGKTKSGCSACKVRHVKCGEERPICNNCARRKTQCIYPENPAFSHRSPSEASSAPDDPGPQSFDALDLTLMHRYSTATAARLLPAPSAQHVFQAQVPMMAQDNVLLHHGMLALAALDLAQEAAGKGDRIQMARYRARGLHHQQISLPLFRSLLEQRDGANTVIFLYSIMLVVITFASALSAETRPNLDDVLDLFGLFRGPRAMWSDHREGMNGDLIESMFPPMPMPPRMEQPGDAQLFESLDKLAIDAGCADAISHIKFEVHTFHMRPLDVRAMGWFPALCSETYYAHVRQHQPAALAILKVYAAILEPFRSRWWIGDWCDILDSAIADVVNSEALSLPEVGDLLGWHGGGAFADGVGDNMVGVMGNHGGCTQP